MSPILTARSPEFVKEVIVDYYHDPTNFVRCMFPWQEVGKSLERYEGPDKWQTQFLDDLGAKVRERAFDGISAVPPIRMSISKGHGIGGTTLLAWVVCWIMSTRPNSKGSVTANTFTQLQTKTWAAIQYWSRLSLTSSWFKVTGEKMSHTAFGSNWFCSAQSSREENSEAFAGQHAADSTSFYIFDEASAIPDKIFEVAEGGLTDGEPMIFLFGNPTRSAGKFHRTCFGAERDRWDHRSIDSREAIMSNKQLIAEWIEDYGEDSDFVRVRVRGIPPRASEAQFIDADRVRGAQLRDPQVLDDEPLVAGVDFAWGGDDDNVVRFRRGNDARSIKPIRIAGEFTRDPSVMTAKLEDVLTREHDVGNGKKQKVAMLFLDSAGIAGPVGARLRLLGHSNVIDVNFGADSPDEKYAYLRDFMWGKLKDWLLNAAIDKDPQLEADLCGPGVVPDRKQRVKLEPKEAMKKRGVDSPDDGDALALTFAHPVMPKAAYKARSAPTLRPWS